MSKIFGIALAATMALISTSAIARNNAKAIPSQYQNDPLYYSEEYSPVYSPYIARHRAARMDGSFMPFTWVEKRSFDRAAGDTF